jgi:HSP20 family protein
MSEAQSESASTKGGAQTREDRTAGRNGDRANIEETRSFGRPAEARGELVPGHSPGRALFEPFLAAHLEMNRWFDELWRQATGIGVSSMRTARPFAEFGPASVFGLPATDLKETEKAYLLSVELPGLSRDNIDLKIRGDSLVITGQKAEEKDDAGATYRFSERRFGRFERAFPLPHDVERARIAATFNDGVLKLELPRAAEAGDQARRIEIR